MDLGAVAVDISSDEEGGEVRDWLTELLEADGWDGNESDEVTVIGEVNPRQRTTMSNPEDDDCVVLDGDPDGLVRDYTDSASGADDLVIVGEKGQIACRDYPHSRSLCAKFPFNSTPHERHCDMCHCYVCDSPAPCTYWYSGIPILDHCHATDKEDVWKLLRRDFKEVKKANFDSVPSVSPQSSTITQGQIPRQTMIRACSVTTNSALPTVINQGRTIVPENNLVQNRYEASIISQQLLNVRNNDIRRDRVHSSGNLGSRSIYSPPTFKSAVPVSRILPRRPLYGSTNNIHPSALGYCRGPRLVSTLSQRNPANWQHHDQALNSELLMYQSSYQSIRGNCLSHGGPHQPRADGQAFVQEHSSETQPLVDPCFADASLTWQNHNASLSSKNFSNDPQYPKPSNCSTAMDHHPELLPVSKPSGSSTVTQYDCELSPFLRPAEPSTISVFDPQFPPLLSPARSSVLKDFEDWLMENQSVSEAFEGTMPFQPNIAPPNSAAPIDPGVFLYDL